MAYLRLRFRAFTVGVAESPTMFLPLAESRCGATQRSAMPDCRDKGRPLDDDVVCPALQEFHRGADVLLDQRGQRAV